jgi:integrase
MPTWVKRWGYEMADKPTRPGIYRLRAGGFYVRSKVTDRRTGRRREVSGVLLDVTMPAEAQRRLDDLVARARAEARGETIERVSWGSFALSRLRERVRRGKVGSEATLDRWKEALALFVPEWGHLDVRDVRSLHIDRWLESKVASWMTTGKVSKRKRLVGDGPRRKRELKEVEVFTVIKPTTVNGWLRVLRSISHAAKVKFGLAKSAFEGVEFFEEGRLFSKEAPNALPPELLPMFMAIARDRYPQHYPMILLGFVTGLRPSSLRPLRRKGPEADIDWTTGRIEVRRSHSRRQTVMNRTKTGKDNSVALPATVLEVLREHAASLSGKAAESDLLFPNEKGGLRTRNVLAKPFAAIGAELGLSFRLTPKGMRRTFNDVAREAGIHDVVTRSISGHVTDTMQRHYSTARDEEQRSALEKAHALIEGDPGGKTGGRPTK